MERPKSTDRHMQHYWDLPHRIVLFGSGKGRRPVLKLAETAQGFDDPAKPKYAVWIWAQTRDDAPGKQEPEWGKEQPNIAFSHFLKGIDIDIRGHAGAVGLRFSASQGSSLLDCTVQADGALAGFSDCPGQGGGTYNIATIGGRYGITLDSQSRFPILTGCEFTGQSVACIGYHTSTQVPTLLVGCRLAPESDAAVDFTRHTPYAGIGLVDCLVAVKPGGVVAKTKKRENVFVETTYVDGAARVTTTSKPFAQQDGWTQIQLFSSTTPGGVQLISGKQSQDDIEMSRAVPAGPPFDTLRDKHYRPVPCWDATQVVSVKDFGAVGDGQADDTEAFRQAVAAGDEVFIPKGSFKLTGTLQLRPNTHLFGLTRTYSSLGSGPSRRFTRRASEGSTFTIVTVDAADAAPGFSHLAVRGDIQWRSGKGTSMLAGGIPRSISGHGGGRIYGATAMGRQLVMEGLKNPISLYSFNVERVTTNPQSVFRNCEHLRIYYFKVEAGTLNRGGDANTPAAIENCRDVRIYSMYGNVRGLGKRPMLDVAHCDDILVSQLKAFRPEGFPHITELEDNGSVIQLPSSKTCALFARNPQLDEQVP